MGAWSWIWRALGVRQLWRVRSARRFSTGLVRGFYVAHAVGALFRLGVWPLLRDAEGVDIASLAAERGWEGDLLQAVCDYLYGLGVLDRVDGRYRLSTYGRTVDELALGGVLSTAAYEPLFHHLVPSIRDGIRPAGNARLSDLVAIGSGLSARLLAFPLMAELVEETHARRVLDLACGDGTFLSFLCQRNAGLEAIGVDLSQEAIAAGRQHLVEAGLKARVQLVCADMLEIDRLPLPWDDVQMITCIYALHELLENEDRLVDLLARIRQRFPAATLAICEVIRHRPEELRRHRGGLLEIQLVHDVSGQQLATRSQWLEMLRQGGYGSVEERYLGFIRTAFFIARP